MRSYDIFFFFNDTATTEIYTLSLHDALPISGCRAVETPPRSQRSQVASSGRIPIEACSAACSEPGSAVSSTSARSEEHTSELQSRQYLVCRLLLEKKNNLFLFYIPVLFSTFY